MTTLKQARENGQLNQFAKDREADAPGDKAAFEATLQSMAGKSKAAPATSKPDCADD